LGLYSITYFQSTKSANEYKDLYNNSGPVGVAYSGASGYASHIYGYRKVMPFCPAVMF